MIRVSGWIRWCAWSGLREILDRCGCRLRVAREMLLATGNTLRSSGLTRWNLQVWPETTRCNLQVWPDKVWLLSPWLNTAIGIPPTISRSLPAVSPGLFTGCVSSYISHICLLLYYFQGWFPECFFHLCSISRVFYIYHLFAMISPLFSHHGAESYMQGGPPGLPGSSRLRRRTFGHYELWV
jgi:hypothetical protein